MPSEGTIHEPDHQRSSNSVCVWTHAGALEKLRAAPAQDAIRGLLAPRPEDRLGNQGDAALRALVGGTNTHLGSEVGDIEGHPFWSKVDWDALYYQIAPPPWVPDLSGPCDTSHYTDARSMATPLSRLIGAR